MYELKVLTPKFNTPEVDCIYKVKKIGQFTQEECNSEAQKNCGFDLNILAKKIQLASKSSTQTNMILERQMQVIQQLEALQAKLASIREKCNLSAPLPVTTRPAKQIQCEDFVIKAPANQVPYTLLALRNLLKNSINFDIHVFKHSSVPKLGKEAQYFEQQLAENKPTNNSGLSTVKITLIWLDSEQTSMISSEANYMPLYGEVNILRYLARIGTPNLGYEHLSIANEIDALLDNCHQVLRLRSAAARKMLLNGISAHLGNEFLFKQKNITVADIMLYCTIKQAVPAKDLNLPSKDLNSQLKGWRSRVENIIAI